THVRLAKPDQRTGKTLQQSLSVGRGVCVAHRRPLIPLPTAQREKARCAATGPFFLGPRKGRSPLVFATVGPMKGGRGDKEGRGRWIERDRERRERTEHRVRRSGNGREEGVASRQTGQLVKDRADGDGVGGWGERSGRASRVS